METKTLHSSIQENVFVKSIFNKIGNLSPYLKLLSGLMLFFVIHCSSQRVPVGRQLELPVGDSFFPNNSRVDLIQAFERKPGYQLYFDRSTDTSAAAYYLRIAEAIYPDPKKVELPPPSTDHKRITPKNWYFEKLWWFEDFRGKKIPYSITGDAVNFYLNQYRSFKKKLKERRAKTKWRGSNENRVFFHYSATVKSLPVLSDLEPGDDSSPDSVTTVTLLLKWYEFRGQTHGWGFEKTREVVFSGKRRVVEIKGDGFTKKWISSEKTPYAPIQWITY
jgi:hypothetical protein